MCKECRPEGKRGVMKPKFVSRPFGEREEEGAETSVTATAETSKTNRFSIHEAAQQRAGRERARARARARAVTQEGAPGK